MDIQITNEDNMELMARYDDNHFELAIVDPPYGIGNWIPSNVPKNGRKASEKVEWNDSIPNESYFTELIRVSKNQVIWGANYYNCFSDGGSALIWHKGKINPIFSQCEIASVSFGKKVDYIHIDWQAGFFRTMKEGEQIHPCQKPVQLYEWLLMNYAKQGDKILDTHLGSGSIAIACHNLGFDLTACELDKEYFDAAIKRLNQHQAQQRLF
jgi:site-specific DNA-methyltransferase (adenine-specific)